MRDITQRELRQIELDMITYIDQICRAEGIEYSLAAGSLLGAVKYGGYIPWDDDIDLMLTRPNYEKLMAELMKPLPDNFSLLYYKVQETYLPFAKLYDNRTAFNSKLDTLHQGTGVFIDIFPVDTLPNNRIEGENFKRDVRQAVTHLIASCTRGLTYASSEHKRYFLIKMVLWLPSHITYYGKYQELAGKVDQLMQTYNGTDNGYCNFVWSPPKRTGYFDKDIFRSYEDVKFEGLTLRKIANHDTYLTELYGNYSEPPQKSKKRNHDYYHWYWKE